MEMKDIKKKIAEMMKQFGLLPEQGQVTLDINQSAISSIKVTQIHK